MQQITSRSTSAFGRCLLRNFDLEIDVGFAPWEGNSGEPVFLPDGLTGVGPIFRRENSRRGGELGSGDLATRSCRA
jgi:hypothetical protein